jgi:formyl-CoA transferase
MISWHGAAASAGAVFDTGDLLRAELRRARHHPDDVCYPSGELRMPTFPVHFDGAPPPVTPAPLLGEHTAEVFADWFGISAADLKSLRDEGVV